MLDGITLERRGIPTAVVGSEKLLMSSGRAMARAQGMPNLPLAKVFHLMGALNDVKVDKELQDMAEVLAPQVESILLRGEA